MDIGRWPPESIAAPPNAPPYSHHYPPSHHHHLASSSFSYPPVSHPPQSKDPAAAASASAATKLALHHQDYGLLVAQSATHHYEYVGHADASLRPPGIEYGSPTAGLGNPSYAPQSIGPEAAYQVVFSYQEEPHKQQALLAKESIRQYGVDPLAYANVVRSQSVIDPTAANAAAAAAAAWNQTYATFSNVLPKKLIKKKKNKVVQSAYCAVCKIDCNSKDVLDKHKNGKKHLRNMTKLEEGKNSKKGLAKAAAVDTKKTPPATNEKQTASAAPKEDLEKKRQKLLEGGASAAEVRVCILCGTVCNSKTVYDFHIAGKKHAAQLKKLAEARAVSGV
ncbi:uncharacterized protein LOC116257267 [Nymphaea colorata]|nr:uncharacterized protein LOC116257267 [Nymphaea colorata]